MRVALQLLRSIPIAAASVFRLHSSHAALASRMPSSGVSCCDQAVQSNRSTTRCCGTHQRCLDGTSAPTEPPTHNHAAGRLAVLQAGAACTLAPAGGPRRPTASCTGHSALRRAARAAAGLHLQRRGCSRRPAGPRRRGPTSRRGTRGCCGSRWATRWFSTTAIAVTRGSAGVTVVAGGTADDVGAMARVAGMWSVAA
jgi:hypothetical protein